MAKRKEPLIVAGWKEKIEIARGKGGDIHHYAQQYKDADNDALLNQYNKKHNIDWGAYEETDEDGQRQKARQTGQQPSPSCTNGPKLLAILRAQRVSRCLLPSLLGPLLTALLTSGCVESSEQAPPGTLETLKKFGKTC